jgi:hypothetical protein
VETNTALAVNVSNDENHTEVLRSVRYLNVLSLLNEVARRVTAYLRLVNEPVSHTSSLRRRDRAPISFRVVALC